MKVGIIFACETESKPFRSWLKERGHTLLIRGKKVYREKIGLSEVAVTVSGMGKKSASTSAQILIGFGAKLLINCGTAGAINPERQIGQIVIANKIIEEKGSMTATDPSLVQASLKAVQQLGWTDRVFVGPIITTEKEVKEKSQKEMLYQKFQAEAADMEGIGVARTCRLHHTPCLVIKGITDLSCPDAREEFFKNVESVSQDMATLLIYLLKQLPKLS